MNSFTTQSARRFRRLRGALFILAAAGLGWTAAAIADDHTEDKVVVSIDPASLDRAPGRSMPVSFADVVKAVGPAVVQVNVTAEAKRISEADLPPFMQDPRWRRFFGIPDNLEQPQRPPQQGTGSGVIVSSDGYILTNNHVVQNAAEIEVTLSDRREVSAEIVGTDPDSDLAVIKIDLSDLPAVVFADSDTVEVGDVVLAVGNPFGLGQTVTSGIVSALGRATMGLGYEDFIQTDAAINPGNSGGALVDAEGRLVGINTAILSRSGGFMGIGFAIPANLARNIMQQLATHGEVVRGFLGFYGEDLSRELAPSFDLDEDQRGVLVNQVTEDTPADRAGLQAGDIITHIGGREMETFRALRFAIADKRPGTEISLTIIRDGDEDEIEAIVGSREDIDGTGGFGSGDDEGLLSGVGVGNIDPESRRQYGIPSRIQGALVTSVEADSAAAGVGLRQGDVILEINRQRVRNADDAMELTAESTSSMRTLLRIYNSRIGFRYIIVDESDR
ncbi:DegQ family serine endoprotease [Opitutaceae bacterium]|jgi:serine protease Do|nr:DegQ family serine endoprotease [Opitutaceae bacterium]